MVLSREPLPGTNIYVDFFSGKRGAIYILSHCHTDHMCGLKRGWDNGKLYCSEVTSHLLDLKGVTGACGMPYDTPFKVIDNICRQTRLVTLVNAGHCPGSAIVIVEDEASGVACVNTGDFRVYPGLFANPTLQRISRGDVQLQHLFIDGSWADAAFPTLPTKQDSVDTLIAFVMKHCPEERIALHSHGLGDEALLEGIVAEFPGERILVMDANRFKALRITHPDLVHEGIFTKSYADTPRFVLVKNHAQRRSLPPSMQSLVEISCSTLWWVTRAKERLCNGRVEPCRDDDTGIYHILYSMHSCYNELIEFRNYLRPRRTTQICAVISSGSTMAIATNQCWQDDSEDEGESDIDEVDVDYVHRCITRTISAMCPSPPRDADSEDSLLTKLGVKEPMDSCFSSPRRSRSRSVARCRPYSATRRAEQSRGPSRPRVATSPASPVTSEREVYREDASCTPTLALSPGRATAAAREEEPTTPTRVLSSLPSPGTTVAASSPATTIPGSPIERVASSPDLKHEPCREARETLH